MSFNLSYIKFENSLSKEWEFINSTSNGTFLTSLDWINFQRTLGKEIDQYLVKKDSEFVAIVYIEVYKRKVSKFAYTPYGPVVKNISIDVFFKDFYFWAQDYAKKKYLNSFRLDPFIGVDNKKLLKDLGYVESMAPTQAKYVWEIDISQEEDLLFSDLKKVARYNIRSSYKAGIEIEKVESIDKVKEFYSILEGTTQRHKFASFNEDYFFKQFELLNNNLLSLYLAKKDGKYISGALINTYNNIGYYSHGGSVQDKELQKYGASYLLHWEIIKDLKSKGFTKYNMWGVLPEGSEINNGMKGVSEFKRRFGGKQIDLVGGLEIPASNKYKIQRLFEYFIYKKDRY